MTKQEIRAELKKLNPEQLENVLVSILEMTLFNKSELQEIIKNLNAELEAEKAETLEEVIVAFPSLNKNHHITDNDEEIARKSNIEKCLVKKTVTLSKEEFEEVSFSLLDSRPEMFEKIGGTYIEDDSLFDGVKQYSNEWRAIIAKHGYTLVVKVQCENDVFYVDTSGHDYARYVGREATDALKSMVK